MAAQLSPQQNQSGELIIPGLPPLPSDWNQVLMPLIPPEIPARLGAFLAAEKTGFFPPKDLVFSALKLTSYQQVKVVILGQDPYHDDGQAHGLAFSVPSHRTKLPPSLKNIFKELTSDLQISPPENGNLEPWAKQGVLLLNTILTVRPHQAESHRKQGWEEFTDAIISALNNRPTPVIFLLWGSHAQSKIKLISNPIHTTLSAPHPSPLSAHRGFFGSRPFSTINSILSTPIQWQLKTPDSLF